MPGSGRSRVLEQLSSCTTISQTELQSLRATITEPHAPRAAAPRERLPRPAAVCGPLATAREDPACSIMDPPQPITVNTSLKKVKFTFLQVNLFYQAGVQWVSLLIRNYFN